jgi:hypothetical protein
LVVIAARFSLPHDQRWLLPHHERLALVRQHDRRARLGDDRGASLVLHAKDTVEDERAIAALVQKAAG